MKRIASALAIFLTQSGFSHCQAQQAYIDACAKSLNVNEVSGYSDSVLQLAILSYMTSQSSDEQDFHSKFSGLIAAGFFDGTLNGARQKRDQLEKELNLSFNHESSSGYMAKYLSTEGAGAFSQCVNTVFAAPGIHLSVQDADDTSVSAQLIYRTSPGENRTFKIRIASDGDMPAGIQTQVPSSGVTRSFIITKSNPVKNLHIQVDIMNGADVVASDSLFIPPFSTATSTTSRNLKTSTESQSQCGSYRDSKSYPGTQVTINPDDGYLFDLQTISSRITSLSGEHGKVPGSNSKIEVTKQDFTSITARAWCEPGSSTDDHYWVNGVIECYQTKTTAKVSSPVDNGVSPKFRVLLE